MKKQDFKWRCFFLGAADYIATYSSSANPKKLIPKFIRRHWVTKEALRRLPFLPNSPITLELIVSRVINGDYTLDQIIYNKGNYAVVINNKLRDLDYHPFEISEIFQYRAHGCDANKATGTFDIFLNRS